MVQKKGNQTRGRPCGSLVCNTRVTRVRFLTVAVNVDWAPELLMDAICQKQCLCNYDGKNRTTPLPKCPDVPDDPKAGKWCSLCGPKYNAPIQIDLFRCKDRFNATNCPGPKGVPGTGTKRAAQLM